MAEENTTDLTPTTDATVPMDATTQGTTPSDLSTTEQTTPEGDDAPKTLLTDAPKEDEPKADEPKGDEPKEDEKPDEKAEMFGAPEGDYELELPEGTEIDKDALGAFSPVAKELGLSNKGASMIAGVYAEKVLPAVVDQLNESLQRDIAAQHTAWAEETEKSVKEDPVFNGTPLAKVQQVAAKALDRFFGEDARKYLDETGLGNHPAMMKGMFLVGSAIAEDTTFERGDQGSKPKSRTEKYYGDQT